MRSAPAQKGSASAATRPEDAVPRARREEALVLDDGASPAAGACAAPRGAGAAPAPAAAAGAVAAGDVVAEEADVGRREHALPPRVLARLAVEHLHADGGVGRELEVGRVLGPAARAVAHRDREVRRARVDHHRVALARNAVGLGEREHDRVCVTHAAAPAARRRPRPLREAGRRGGRGGVGRAAAAAAAAAGEAAAAAALVSRRRRRAARSPPASGARGAAACASPCFSWRSGRAPPPRQRRAPRAGAAAAKPSTGQAQRRSASASSVSSLIGPNACIRN